MKPYDYLKKTSQFVKWYSRLDAQTKVRVTLRAEQARETGHLGDHHGIRGKSREGNRIAEMRVDSGPGWRLYYTAWEYKGRALLLLLGGEKSTQQRDIERALAIVDEARRKAEQEIDEELREHEEKKNGRHGKNGKPGKRGGRGRR